MARRKRLELDERRTQLLALGRSLFSERSYDDVSIDEIASLAGISKGLLYHYFKSKRQFYVATVREAAEELTASTVPDAELPPRDQVIQGVNAYLSFVEANASAYTSLMHGGIGVDREVHGIVEGVRERFAALIVDRMGPSGVTPAQRILVRGWVGMVEASSLEWLRQGNVTREELTRVLLGALAQTLALGATVRKAE